MKKVWMPLRILGGFGHIQRMLSGGLPEIIRKSCSGYTWGIVVLVFWVEDYQT